MGLNDKNIGKKCQFIKKCGLLSGYIADRIDNNQNIKRYLKYQTKNPLGQMGISLDNKKVPQPDIIESLIDEDYIMNGMFDEDMSSIVKNQVFIHVYNGNKTDMVSGQVNIAINILIDKKFEYLSNSFELRSYAIADEIENMFSDTYIDRDNSDNDIIKDLGNLKFSLNRNSFTYSRLSKSNNIVLFTLILTTNINPIRIGDK